MMIHLTSAQARALLDAANAMLAGPQDGDAIDTCFDDLESGAKAIALLAGKNHRLEEIVRQYDLGHIDARRKQVRLHLVPRELYADPLCSVRNLYRPGITEMSDEPNIRSEQMRRLCRYCVKKAEG